jgi:hypothetical protein
MQLVQASEEAARRELQETIDDRAGQLAAKVTQSYQRNPTFWYIVLWQRNP